MTMHSSAPAHGATPHATPTTKAADIINALKQRALKVLNDPSIPHENRALLRYALEINDPWFSKMIREMDAEQAATDELNTQTDSDENEPDEDKLEALIDLICRPGNEPQTKSGALLVLMSTLEKSYDPTELANKAKHLAFAHYGDLTVDNVIDSQIERFEAELLQATQSSRKPVDQDC